MPKSLVLGNGNVLIGYDRHGQVNDFYYDYVGMDNHMAVENVNRVGVWVDGEFSWLSDPQWNVDIDYVKETLGGRIVAKNEGKEIEIEFIDTVYNEKNIYIRKGIVRNQASWKRDIRVFLNHEFQMYRVRKGDTVYFDPAEHVIIHYKGRRVAIIGGERGEDSFDQWTVGLSGIEGKEGTWRDAEDGNLQQNPIEHGVVDSTIGFSETVDARESFEFKIWICFAKTIGDAKALHKYVKKKTSDHMIDSTHNFWHAWVNKTNFSFYGLDEKHIELFKKSLLITRTHVDNTGGIIASGDSDLLQYGRDNYSYVWPRDAAFVAIALDKAGYFEVTRNFFRFSADTISTEGYFYHKYMCDKSLGSSWHPWIVDGVERLPIQEDETALVIIAFWHHYRYTKDLEFVERLYNPLIKRAAEFMCEFRGEQQLPKPSYDLWEMKFGIHSFTVGTVYGALKAAANFAKTLGKKEDQIKYETVAKEVRRAFIKYMFNKRENYFYKLIDFDNGKVLHDETIDASSFFGAFRFGLLDPIDERVEQSFKVLKDRLIGKSDIGGVVRFEGDAYYRSHPQVPGNPWIITSLWLAQYYIARAKKKEDMGEVKSILEWVVDRSSAAGLLSEQLDPYTGQQLSASPLTWSHAEYITTIISYLEKLNELGVCEVSFPLDKQKLI